MRNVSLPTVSGYSPPKVAIPLRVMRAGSGNGAVRTVGVVRAFGAVRCSAILTWSVRATFAELQEGVAQVAENRFAKLLFGVPVFEAENSVHRSCRCSIADRQTVALHPCRWLGLVRQVTNHLFGY